MATQHSSEPFQKALGDLLEEHQMSQRELVAKTRRHGWGSSGHLSFIMRETMPPSSRAIEAIARAFGISPDYFMEYRLLKARESLDPAAVGFDQAAANLRVFESALVKSGTDQELIGAPPLGQEADEAQDE